MRNETTSQLILSARKRAGLTRKELAIKAGVAQSQLSRWERGEEPRIASLRKLAKALKVRLAELIG